MTCHIQSIMTWNKVSTHMPLARHDADSAMLTEKFTVSTHMPLARHDAFNKDDVIIE